MIAKKRWALFGVCLACFVVVVFYRITPTTADNAAQPAHQGAEHSSRSDHIVDAPTMKKETPELEFFQQIADSYASDLKIPSYSRSLSEHDFDVLHPNHFYPKVLPAGKRGDRVQLALNKYRFVCPEPVVVEVSGEGIEFADAILVDQDSDAVLQSAPMVLNAGRHIATFSGRCDFPRNLSVVGKVRMASGRPHEIRAILEYQLHNPATVTGIGSTWADGADMVVEAALEVQRAGHFFLSANLFDAAGAPVAHLSQSADLDVGSNTIQLRGHQSVLQGRGSSFSLANLNLKRYPSAPSDRRSYGVSMVDRHVIDYFDVDILEPIAHQPAPDQLARLEFLKKITGSNIEKDP